MPCHAIDAGRGERTDVACLSRASNANDSADLPLPAPAPQRISRMEEVMGVLRLLADLQYRWDPSGGSTACYEGSTFEAERALRVPRFPLGVNSIP